MYRDWREVTKILLSAKVLTEGAVPKSKMKRPETRLYVRWVIKEINRDRSAFDTYTKGKGIISTREKFMEWLETDEGKAGLKSVKANTDVAVISGPDTKFGKTIIVPVAIPGCGTSYSMNKLF